ncbi:hypothetical protein EJ06DRAFT_529713 [Trichodelitschia bisporula]|uniref:Mitotic checkpoint regulator, MAD2B-interacting-domain-containing protein n=1 Tax=Trichodelitschia bisporula TaxID=703511 RepID=A0A6G1HX54_9PEZI|nr:hypothetical protein EJ06DRAFT_529713 [Trichodelitschia bisporula]
MNSLLVAYSDSEDSDNETPVQKPAPPEPAKPAARKLIDPSTHKVRVNLSSLASSTDDIDKDAPPAKKPRTGGALNINAFLPAPKRALKGMGTGVNLKTGAAPAFSREAPASDHTAEEASTTATGAATAKVEPMNPGDSVKIVGKATVFKPLSVARRAQKKRPHPSSAAAAEASKASNASASTAPSQALPAKPTKPKVSLFSITTEEIVETKAAPTEAYKPVLLEPEEDNANEYQEETSWPEQPAQKAAPSGLEVSDLNLSQAEMKRIFGRKAGKAGGLDLSGVNIGKFNTDAEYEANEELRARGETAVHNPVRTIAPGKHSLKQLLNQATAQKEALEEHFAQGKRNQREAGARYGW